MPCLFLKQTARASPAEMAAENKQAVGMKRKEKKRYVQ
jgi:hypothetical protein